RGRQIAEGHRGDAQRGKNPSAPRWRSWTQAVAWVVPHDDSLATAKSSVHWGVDLEQGEVAAGTWDTALPAIAPPSIGTRDADDTGAPTGSRSSMESGPTPFHSKAARVRPNSRIRQGWRSSSEWTPPMRRLRREHHRCQSQIQKRGCLHQPRLH